MYIKIVLFVIQTFNHLHRPNVLISLINKGKKTLLNQTNQTKQRHDSSFIEQIKNSFLTGSLQDQI